MRKGGIGGGKTITGLKFESRVTLRNVIATLPGYKISDDNVYFDKDKVAELYGKHNLYKNLLKPKGIDYLTRISKYI